MKRFLVGLAVVVLGLAAFSFSAAAPDKANASCVPGAGSGVGPDTAKEPMAGPPDCPATHSCATPGELCRDSLGGCSAITDLGNNKCRLAGGGFFDCPQGQTVHFAQGCRCISAGECPLTGSHLVCM